ncbi:serine hydrolase [Neolewinella sp.]|uniref:serine hydrolase n=1 Tax=Neolewinella sp. TaxID=2993543 RepID=UPI003B522A00
MMATKITHLTLFFPLVVLTACVEHTPSELAENTTTETATPVVTSTPPATITRSIIQDSAGDIWIAAFDGVFRYDGTTFTNVMEGVSTSRFFSALEDSEGTLWFGSIGSGVYAYDGSRFRNYTTLDGLLNNEVTSIYEDSGGGMWFGVNGGVSRYDGTTFQNFVLKDGRMENALPGETTPDLQRPPSEVTAITEDRSGNLWLATRGSTFVYDGSTFTAQRHDGGAFTNVRSVIADGQGTIWLGGQDGLWRYAKDTFDQVSPDFVIYVYEAEDRAGNIWTTQLGKDDQYVLAQYSVPHLTDTEPTVREIASPHAGNRGMLFGILEARDESVWFGGLDGVYRWREGKVEGFTDTLEAAYRAIADDLTGTLGVSALHIETGKSHSFNGGDRFPMQSVYKFPIAMVMLEEIDAGGYALTDSVVIAPSEYIPARGHSPIRDRNWTTPEAMSELLAVLHRRKFLSDRSYALLAGYMNFSNQYFDKRIKQLLPAGTEVIHKTGTAATMDGLTRATNDVGIITLPDGNHLAVAVFISDSRDSQVDRELAIARAAKASYDYWVAR